jgi:Chaperone of endosialidase
MNSGFLLLVSVESGTTGVSINDQLQRGNNKMSKKFTQYAFLAIASAICVSANTAQGQASTGFTYQGQLNEAGLPADGAYPMTFRLYDAAIGGAQIGPSIVVAQSVANGLFDTPLDFGAVDFGNDQYWLEIVVDGTTLTPRQAVSGSPYAVQTRGIFVDTVGNVGIGINAPLFPFHVETLNATTAIRGDQTSQTGSVWGLRGTSASSSGIGVYGSNSSETGDARGGFFSNLSNTGGGVEGRAAASSGPTYGVFGDSLSSGGRGVFGSASSSTGTTTGVFGTAFSPDGTGVFGAHTSTTGTAPGVQGNSSSTNALANGVFGRITSVNPGPSSAAVRGQNMGEGVLGIGVWGSQEGTGWGVYGESNGTTGGLGIGVYGRSRGPDAFGVYGLHGSDSGTASGVFGSSFSTSSMAVGVHGRIASTSPGGFSAAVRGQNMGESVLGIGVWGSQEGSGWGVNGEALGTTGIGIGVRGASNSPQGSDFFAAGAGVNYASSSSIRWKSDIVNIDHPLTKLAKLRGVYYTWDQTHGGQHDLGMIAEEVGKVLPEIVAYEENGVDAKGLDYSKLTPLLVEATNALRAEKDAQIEMLESQLKEMQVHNAALESRLRRLESIISGQSK